MLKYLFLISYFFLFILPIKSQVTQQWVEYYDGPSHGFDIAEAIFVDNSGFIYLTGWDNEYGHESDYVTIKYNSSGSRLWVSRYNGPGSYKDFANAINVDNSGNVLITGSSYGYGSNNEDYATIKYNSAGEQQWVRRISGPTYYRDEAFAIGSDNQNNIYVSGVAFGGFATVKYNSAGDSLWCARLNGPTNYGDRAVALKIDSRGNILITGTFYCDPVYITCTKITTIKYDSLGNQLWIQNFDSLNYINNAVSLCLDNLDNVYVTGYNDNGIITIKYNSEGIKQWSSIYYGNGSYGCRPSGISSDKSGNVYVCGSDEVNNRKHDFVTIKYNTGGSLQWSVHYNGIADSTDIAVSLVSDKYNNIYVTGYSYGMGTKSDWVTIKYNTNGIQQWIMRFNGTGNNDDIPTSIAIDTLNNLYVTGYSQNNQNNADITTVKYSQTVGINKINIEVPDKYSLSQNYPNPFNPETKINFAIPKSSYVSLKIYDVSGRKIAEFVNSELKAGIYESEFKAGYLSSGVYYYKIEAGSFTETKKMILIK